MTSKHNPVVVTFAVERLKDILPEMEELWRLHWQETEGYRDALGYNPDVRAFRAFDEAGMFREYTAREAGRLVGHIGFIVFKSRHTQTLTAGEDFFYFRPEARRGVLAVQFLRYALAQLRAEGVEAVTMSSKLSNDIDPLLKRVGFDLVAKQYQLLFKGA